MNSEHIKNFPLCFRAYLADISNQDTILVGDEDMFPESYIGGYLNWFLEKKRFDIIESQLKEALAIIEELRTSNEFYAETNHWKHATGDYGNSYETRQSVADYEKTQDKGPPNRGGMNIFTGGKLARATKKNTDERIEKLRKEICGSVI